jgi:hypothetical protein
MYQDKEGNKFFGLELPSPELRKLHKDFTEAKAAKSDSWYRSSHYDEPNVLAHLRFNERTDADGKRVMFIEEIQSDWHQAGREKGYKSDATRDDLYAKWNAPTVPEGKNPDNYKGFWDIYRKLDDSHVLRVDEAKEYTETEAIDKALTYVKSKGVPDAPFKTSWPGQYRMTLTVSHGQQASSRPSVTI